MKLRLRTSKLGKVRFTSHRDAARIWERGLRRASLPLAFSEGFTPRPKISFGLALPTGAESTAEYVDIELRDDISARDIDLDRLVKELSAALPTGFDVMAITPREPAAASLQEAVTSCTWELWHPKLDADDYAGACSVLDRDQVVIERERKGKQSSDDVRPMLLDLKGGDQCLIATLATIGRALRPSELAEVIFPHVDAREVRARRTHQWIDTDEGRREPIALPVVIDASPQAVLA